MRISSVYNAFQTLFGMKGFLVGVSMWSCVALAGCAEGSSTESAGGDGGGFTQPLVDDPCGAVGTWSFHEPAQVRCGVSVPDAQAPFTVTADDVRAGVWTDSSPLGDVRWTLDQSTCTLSAQILSWSPSTCLIGSTVEFYLDGGTCKDTYAKYTGDVCECTEPISGCTLTKD